MDGWAEERGSTGSIPATGEGQKLTRFCPANECEGSRAAFLSSHQPKTKPNQFPPNSPEHLAAAAMAGKGNQSPGVGWMGWEEADFSESAEPAKFIQAAAKHPPGGEKVVKVLCGSSPDGLGRVIAKEGVGLGKEGPVSQS